MTHRRRRNYRARHAVRRPRHAAVPAVALTAAALAATASTVLLPALEQPVQHHDSTPRDKPDGFCTDAVPSCWKEKCKASDTVYRYLLIGTYAAGLRATACDTDPCVPKGPRVDAIDHRTVNRIEWRWCGALDAPGARDEQDAQEHD